MNEFLDTAEILIKHFRQPFKARDLINLAFERGLFSDKITGATPHKTMQARLSEDIVKYGENSRFVRTKPGTFFLRELLTTNPEAKRLSDYYRAKRRTPPPPQENVLVFPQETVESISTFQGISKSHTTILRKLLSSSQASYMERMHAESIITHKQILTYIIVRRGRKVLSYKRGNYNRAASFLRGSQCIGFGGHVTEFDNTMFDRADFGIRNNAARELSEELSLPAEDLRRLANGVGLKAIGILNDDSSVVGQRHLAVVMQYEVSETSYWDNPVRGETSITQLRWIDIEAKDVNLREFEYWSQLCIRTYFPNIVAAQPSFRIVNKRRFEEPHLLCVLGGIGSGKSVTTRILKDGFGYKEVNSGRVVAKLIGYPPVPETPRAIFQDAALQFIQSEDGPELLAKSLLSEAESFSSSRVIIDGVRQSKTLKCIRQMAGNMHVSVLFVHTPPDLAFSFYTSREGAQCTQREFLNILTASVEEDVPMLIGEADAVLYNWSGRLAYEEAVENMMKELGISKWNL